MTRGSTAPSEISIGGRPYEWRSFFTNKQNDPGFAHHGVAVGPEGRVYLANASATELIILSGRARSIPLPVTEAHGLAADDAGGIWIADPGKKSVRDDESGEYAEALAAGRVVRLDARTGAITAELPGPAGWRPCGVALHDYGRADDRVWVADGYGDNRVHCFSPAGALLWTSDGSGSGIPFVQPHALTIDTRGGEPTLLIADRGNRRLVTLSLDGEFLRTSGAGTCDSPSGLAVHGDDLWVTELNGRLLRYGPDGALAAAYGTSIRRPGAEWPNWRRGGRVSRPFLRPRKFRSPHGVAVTAEGHILVTEWVIGGRITRLTPLPN